jgi:hypothetical protein
MQPASKLEMMGVRSQAKQDYEAQTNGIVNKKMVASLPCNVVVITII